MTHTSFQGTQRLAAGSLAEVALAVRAALSADPQASILTFEDASGRVVDLDTRGTEAEVLARLPQEEPRGRGRPKLGVTPREVTLLPRHWDWLGKQPGGASVAIRKLVEAAMRSGAEELRRTKEIAYRFMSTMAGDLPGFEEASRALFAGDREKLQEQVRAWPEDIAVYLLKLAGS
ncbi:DUF2239 family protein [Lacibacterium aquatile]|uniref:DUF2239 family protein n=1 Tax=Lacibacterium aquatile TaxID=1168082 RepID=A0ABW5DQM4_9PROT